MGGAIPITTCRLHWETTAKDLANTFNKNSLQKEYFLSSDRGNLSAFYRNFPISD